MKAKKTTTTRIKFKTAENGHKSIQKMKKHLLVKLHENLERKVRLCGI